MMPEAANPPIMAMERPATSMLLARTRCSWPTISGTALRRATAAMVPATPVRTATAYRAAVVLAAGTVIKISIAAALREVGRHNDRLVSGACHDVAGEQPGDEPGAQTQRHEGAGVERAACRLIGEKPEGHRVQIGAERRDRIGQRE